MIALDKDHARHEQFIEGTVVQHYFRRDVPICPKHGTMKAYMTRGRITYYACKGCELRGKSISRIV